LYVKNKRGKIHTSKQKKEKEIDESQIKRKLKEERKGKHRLNKLKEKRKEEREGVSEE